MVTSTAMATDNIYSMENKVYQTCVTKTYQEKHMAIVFFTVCQYGTLGWRTVNGNGKLTAITWVWSKGKGCHGKFCKFIIVFRVGGQDMEMVNLPRLLGNVQKGNVAVVSSVCSSM